MYNVTVGITLLLSMYLIEDLGSLSNWDRRTMAGFWVIFISWQARER